MNHYCHLTTFERSRIELFYRQGHSVRSIATLLKRSPSTISRELQRFSSANHNQDYISETAHRDYLKRRTRSIRPRILTDPKLRNYIIQLIQELHWSPEKISAYLRLAKGDVVSYSTIYREIYKYNLGLPKVHKRGIARQLRHRGKTRRSKFHVENRGKINITHSIHERPQAANNRNRVGDWELDTVMGVTGSEVLVTLVDRHSRKLLASKATSKKSQHVMATLDLMLGESPENKRLTITPDRGKEFSWHQLITNKYHIKFYFPDPHASWQRGSNENTNGLIREYLPKSTNLKKFSDAYINEYS